MLGNAFLIALREIRRNLMRAFLTVLGVIIGVAAVVTMVTLGQGTTMAVKGQISNLGSNLVMLGPAWASARERLPQVCQTSPSAMSTLCAIRSTALPPSPR